MTNRENDIHELVPITGKNAHELRESIVALENMLATMEQKEMKPNHHFAPGIYMRELFIPKDTVLTGKIHLTTHMNLLIKGDITVWTEQGMKRIQAPAILKSLPGTKRVGLTHEDSIWVTVHATDMTDPDEIENTITVKSFAEFEALTQDKNFLEGNT